VTIKQYLLISLISRRLPGAVTKTVADTATSQKQKTMRKPSRLSLARGQAPSLELTRNFVSDITPILPHFTKIDIDTHSGNISVSVNQNSVKCCVCNEWFSNESTLHIHRQQFDCCCEEHGNCFASHDAYVHAQKYEHVRCFVPRCTSRYRHETHWQPATVKAHIREAHYPKGDK
jgi:hypothetical protein